MKYIKRIILLILPIAVFSFHSCKKENNESNPIASLNVINAVVGGGNVKLNSLALDSAKSYNSKTFAIVPGEDLKIFPTNSLLTPYYQNTKPQTEHGKMYSVFLCGQLPNVEAIFRDEQIPSPYRDSIFGVRIINLSPNSAAMNVTLASATNSNVFSNVAFKQITEIVTFPLPTVINANSVTFQIRDVGGVLLASYQLPVSANSLYPGISRNLQRFKNINLVIKGLQGTTTGPDAFGIFPTAMSY
jgi:hypothetical protein